MGLGMLVLVGLRCLLVGLARRGGCSLRGGIRGMVFPLLESWCEV